MGHALGALAGGGMILLILLLVLRFFLQMGWMKPDRWKWLLRLLLISLAVCIAYRLVGALIYFNLYGPVGDVTEYPIIFRSEELDAVYSAIRSPTWIGPLKSAFAWGAHMLGKLLMEQYLLAGELMAFACTLAGSGLLLYRLQKLAGDRAGEEIWFLFLCMPWGVFLFLPGWGPLAYGLGAGAFCLLGKWLPRRSVTLPPRIYSLSLAVAAMGDCAMVYALAAGMLV